MQSVIVCLASNYAVAKQIVKALLAREVGDLFIFAHPRSDQEIAPFEGLKQIVPEPAASTGASAVTGGVIGALASSATLAVPFVGPFIFTLALPITTAFGAAAGAAAGAAKAADPHKTNHSEDDSQNVRKLEDLGIPETEIPRYQSALANGRCLLAVRSTDKDMLRRAEGVYESQGGEDISLFDVQRE